MFSFHNKYLLITFIFAKLSYCLSQNDNNNIFGTVYYTLSQSNRVLSPVLTFYGKTDKSSRFLEARLNYEGMDIASIYGGYCFSFYNRDSNSYLEIVPTVGYLFGTFKGIAPSVQIFFESERIESFIQYFQPFFFNFKEENYAFAWSEILYKFTRNKHEIKFGPTLQNTYSSSILNFDIGIKAALAIGKFEFFTYGFNLQNNKIFMTFGITIESN